MDAGRNGVPEIINCDMMKEKMDVQKAVELLQGLYAGRLDGEERELAEELLKDEGVRRVYEELGDDETLVEELRRYGRFNPVRGRIVFEKRLQRQRMLRWMRRLAAAACVVSALGGGWLLWQERSGEPEVVVATGTAGVGENALRLRLAVSFIVLIVVPLLAVLIWQIAYAAKESGKAKAKRAREEAAARLDEAEKARAAREEELCAVHESTLSPNSRQK